MGQKTSYQPVPTSDSDHWTSHYSGWTGRSVLLLSLIHISQADFSTVWNLADILMGFMAIINIFAILALSNIVIRTLKNYETQKKAGKDPVFKASDIGLDNTDCWK